MRLTRQIKIAFVVPPCGPKTIVRDYAGGLGFEADSGYVLPPLDLLQLAAAARPSLDVTFVDGHAGVLNSEELIGILCKRGTDIAIVEHSIPTLDDDSQFAARLSEAGIEVIPRMHLQDKTLLLRALTRSGSNKCIIGECDDNIVDILFDKDRRGTARLANDTIEVCPKDKIDDLDSLPLPAWDLAADYVYAYPKLGRCVTMLSSRGCPYPCRYYCPYPSIQGVRWRHRTARMMTCDFARLIELGQYRVLFRDPVFTLDERRIQDFCVGINRLGECFEWWCETRADLLPDSLLETMAESGCKGINIGIESGDATLRHGLLKRGVSDDIIERVCQTSKRVGIKIAFLLMVGFPGETRRSIVQTAKLLHRCRPFSIGISFPVHHPGTQFDRDARKQGWIIVDDYQATDGSKPVLAAPSLPASDMIVAKEMLERLFGEISRSSISMQQEAILIDEIDHWANE